MATGQLIDENTVSWKLDGIMQYVSDEDLDGIIQYTRMLFQLHAT